MSCENQVQTCRGCGALGGIPRGPSDMRSRPLYCTKCWEMLTRVIRRENDTPEDRAAAKPLESLESKAGPRAGQEL